MALDLAPLVDRFYDYFLDLYHKQRGSAGGGMPMPPSVPASSPSVAAVPDDAAAAGMPFLAFGSIGTSLTPEMLQLKDGVFFQPLATEQFSDLANKLPLLDGTIIVAPGILTAAGIYGEMLTEAQPMSAADMLALGAIKGEAEPALRAKETSFLHAGGNYLATLPVPPDWALPSGDSLWQNYTYKTTEQTTVDAAPPASPPDTPPRPVWRWRVAPQDLVADVVSVRAVSANIVPPPAADPRVDILQQSSVMEPVAPATATATMTMARVGIAAGLVDRFADPAPSAMLVMRPQGLQAQSQDESAPADAIVAEQVDRSGLFVPIAEPVAPQIVRSQVLQAQLQEVHARSQPQTVTARSMELSFRYCMVEARRPWLSSGFLTARNWYIPRMRAGERASGTGRGKGCFEVIPVAAICVRDLTITAAFSAEERAVLPAMTKFGPFSLIGHEINAAATALTCRGIQVIGWVMQPMPRLPPNDDPALAVR